jgi:hypothetical protein
MRRKNMVMSPARLGTKKYYAVEAQLQFTQTHQGNSHRSFERVWLLEVVTKQSVQEDITR